MIIYRLLFSSIVLLTTLAASSQIEIHSSKKGQSDHYDGYRQNLVGIGTDDFLMVSYISDEKFMDRYNSQHERVYSIPMLNAGYNAYFEFLPESQTITAIEYEPYTITDSEDLFRMYGSRYDARSGELLERKELEASAQSYWNVTFSPNKKLFAMWAVEYPLYAKIYSTENLELLGEINFEPDEDDGYFERSIADNGTVLLSHMTDDDQIRFNFFSQTGELLKSTKVANALGKKETYHNTEIHNSGNHALATCFHNRGDVSIKFFSWKIDFEELSVSEFVEFDLDKHSIPELFYNHSYPGLNLAKPEKMGEEMKLRPLRGLKFVFMNDVITDEAGNFIFIFAENHAYTPFNSSYSTSVYGGKYMLLTAFSDTGQHLWGTALDRRVQSKADAMNNEHVFRPHLSGVKTRVRLVGNALHLINFENPSPVAFGTVYRVMDTQSGKLLSSSLLFEEENLIINTYYMDWLGDHRIVALGMKGQGYKLNGENIRMKTIDLQLE